MGKDCLLNKWCRDSHIQKRETGPFTLQHTKINSKWIRDLNIRPETSNSQKKTWGESSLRSILAMIFFFGSDTKGKHNKNKQVGLHKTTKLPHNKRNHQQNIKQPMEWAENLNQHSSKEDTQLANRYVKGHSTSLIIREM